ncbi:sensor histidine kinase [Paenibacillus sp. KQZ6P-2]|uniref:histidine kinase n=1 Tax=Paenibacillus mangrovi TaxID=2931978 RepID=A0A9X1WV92_9BACL|nr:sensor histidine kinase [Paenibacillus mangrovi]MCJ8014203.1 sensor histidine kinase [Paenibacillus mangrovi]
MRRERLWLFDRMRFKHKLFVSYLTVIIIPILVLGLYAYHQSKQMLEYQGLQGIEKNAGTITASIENSLERYNHSIRSIIYNATFEKIVTNDYIDLVNLSRDLNGYLTPYFNMMKNMDPNIEQITFYTQSSVPEYGDALLSASRVSQERWYNDALLAAPIRNQWFYDDGLIVTAQFPRFNTIGNTNLVYMRINSRDLFHFPNTLQDYAIFIADENHRLIYANPNANQHQGLLSGDLLNENGGMIRSGQTSFFLVKKEIQQTNWTFYCFVPSKKVSEGAGSIISVTMGLILLCIAGLLVIIYIFSRTMIRRIYALNSMMKRVEMGDLSLRVTSSSRDEIGEMTNRFGRMLIRLNELIDESYRSKIVQKEAELRALQWQINPHFLYNTLSFINWRAIKSESHEISDVVTSLSKFYRTALNRGNNITSIRDELENMKSYVDIIQIMRDYSFDVKYEIEEEVYGYQTIHLILQPLVENAILHGIDQKEAGHGLLTVSARISDNTIVFAVEDNGPGMPPDTAERILTVHSTGYGLKNVNDRIQLLFGPEYGISVSSQLGLGTIMTITVPQYRSS